MWERASRKEREKGINRHRPLMSTADSPIQKETTESFLATVEAVLIVLPYCTEPLSKMLCLPLFIQAKVCVCVFRAHQDCTCVCVMRVEGGGGWRQTVCLFACVLACMRATMHVRTETIERRACVARNLRQVSGRSKPGVSTVNTIINWT